jgi:hypothetical protein
LALAPGLAVAGSALGAGAVSPAVTDAVAAACCVGWAVWAEAWAAAKAKSEKVKKACNFMEIPFDAPADEGRTLSASPKTT